MPGAWWVVASVTLREGLRRRLLPALGGLSLVAVLLTAWGYAQLPHLAAGSRQPLTSDELQILASQLLILVMFMFSFVLGLAAVFAAAPSVAGELESGEALAVMARPIRRRSILIGKWVALAAVVTTYALVATACEFVAVSIATGFAPPHPIEAAFYLAGVGLVTLTLTIALSTRLPPVTAGIIAMLLFGLAWLAGVVGGIGLAFDDPITSLLGTVSRYLLPTDGLWRGTIFSLEPFSVLVGGAVAGPQLAAFPFYAAEPPSLLYLGWCVIWVAGILALAVVSFDRRDL
ncbi:MAG: ABC transporter permease [Chloroflexota bacterium]|nr:ABC transporter permease [Chloroflexota bacterium]